MLKKNCFLKGIDFKTKIKNFFFSTYIDFKKMQNVHTRKIRRQKTTHMKYPCIPIWNKERIKDPFDYPLRSKKEIAFEQYINPPIFPVRIIKNDYYQVSGMSTLNVNKADKRNTEIRLEMKLNEMKLSPLQKKRLIFLLGNRYKPGSETIKIVSTKYTNLEHNLTNAFDIFRQLYWEAKRAPLFIWHLTKNHERRKIAKKLFGKVRLDEMKKLKEAADEEVSKKREIFDQVYDSGNYNLDFIYKNMKEIIDKSNPTKKLTEEEEKKKIEETQKKMEEILAKGSLEKELVKKKFLTKKAYDTFFNNNLENKTEQEKNKQ